MNFVIYLYFKIIRDGFSDSYIFMESKMFFLNFFFNCKFLNNFKNFDIFYDN